MCLENITGSSFQRKFIHSWGRLSIALVRSHSVWEIPYIVCWICLSRIIGYQSILSSTVICREHCTSSPHLRLKRQAVLTCSIPCKSNVVCQVGHESWRQTIFGRRPGAQQPIIRNVLSLHQRCEKKINEIRQHRGRQSAWLLIAWFTWLVFCPSLETLFKWYHHGLKKTHRFFKKSPTISWLNWTSVQKIQCQQRCKRHQIERL